MTSGKSNKEPLKSYCYVSKCGPVVETGFHLEKYKVCKTCKKEVTDYLAVTITERLAKAVTEEDDKAKKIQDQIDTYADLFSYQYLGND